MGRWVNEGYGESCLEVAEELANQTPVRLDLLLSLVPPPESTETVVVDSAKADPSVTVSLNAIFFFFAEYFYFSAADGMPALNLNLNI